MKIRSSDVVWGWFLVAVFGVFLFWAGVRAPDLSVHAAEPETSLHTVRVIEGNGQFEFTFFFQTGTTEDGALVGWRVPMAVSIHADSGQPIEVKARVFEKAEGK